MTGEPHPAGEDGGRRRAASVASTALRLTRRGLGYLLFVVSLGMAALMLTPALIGWERYVIVSGSMTGTYDTGSVVFEEPVPVSELRVGDVITYVPPRGLGPDGRITHRIVWIGRDPRGGLGFRTKGDANRTADPWTFSLSAPEQPRAVFGVPYVGYALIALSERLTRMLVIGVPALIIAFAVLAGLWREAGEESRRQARETSGAAA